MDAARCAAINATSCKNVVTTPGNAQSYAVSAAVARGLTGVTSSNVTVSTGSTAQAACGNTTATVVVVVMTYSIGTIYLVPLQSSMKASACFPLASG